MYSEPCLSITSLGPTFVVGINRCSVNTCSINKDFYIVTVCKGRFIQDSFYSGFGLDRCHCTCSVLFWHSKPYVLLYLKLSSNIMWQVASDKVYQLLAYGRWFSPGTPASSTTKTGRHDIAEILLKVALNTINQIKYSA